MHFIDLRADERRLRRDDKAIRLRWSMEQPSTVFVERKTFPGKYGALLLGQPYPPDQGYRRENGHVHVATIRASDYSLRDLQDTLRAADSWRKWEWRAKSRAQRADETDDQYANKERQRVKRQEMLRYKTEDFWNRYAWLTKSRVSVPVAVTA